MRIWSYGLDLWGVIDLRHYEADVLWYFPTRDKREREIQDILQLQDLATAMRESDEQAVQVERDSDNDEKDEEEFTSIGMYKKFEANVKEKKRAQRLQDEKDQKAIEQERRDWLIALENSKKKNTIQMREILPFDRNKRAIERIDELIEKEQNFHKQVLDDDEKTEVVGDIVQETAKKIDRLILKALKKHERNVEDNSSPARIRQKQQQRLLRRSRTRVTSIKSDSASDNESTFKSPLKSQSPVKKGLSIYKDGNLKAGDSALGAPKLPSSITLRKV